jgi:NAD(P)-dependent dehydrogenase (short-subunit alcohol dehydrogenase family)
MTKAVIISISSDIGTALAESYLDQGIDVVGTYRTSNKEIEALAQRGVKLVQMDLADAASVNQAGEKLNEMADNWDFLVVSPGLLEPIGAFDKVDFNAWNNSIQVNFTNQLRITHHLLESRNKSSKLGSLVLFFAGGGTNNATTNFSAYTVSKVALIKMCELLDAEIKDTRFSIVGPGWVKTKIHESVLNAENEAPEGHAATVERYKDDDFVPMSKVVNCCNWLFDQPREVISGRNFSVAWDAWGNESLTGELQKNQNMYKLRRSGNDWKP